MRRPAWGWKGGVPEGLSSDGSSLTSLSRVLANFDRGDWSFRTKMSLHGISHKQVHPLSRPRRTRGGVDRPSATPRRRHSGRWSGGRHEMGCTDDADLEAPGLSDEFYETSSFSDLGQRRLRVLKKNMEAADYAGTTVLSAFSRGWHARMVDGNIRFAEMVVCTLLVIVGVSALSAGWEEHAWAWALSAEAFGSVSHTERVCGRPTEKTALDLAHLMVMVSVWVGAGVVEGVHVEKTPLLVHLGYHIFVRTVLPLFLMYQRGAGVVDAFVASHPERVIELLATEDTTLVPRAGGTYDINTIKQPGPTVRKLRRRYIEYRSNNGWFRSVGGINRASKEGIFFFYGIPYYARKTVVVNPGRDTPELIVGELDVVLFRSGYVASALGVIRNCLTVCVLINKDLDTIERLFLVMPLLGELWGVPWALMRHTTWDADWLLGLLSPSHVLWSWHYEDRPRRRRLLWAKAVCGLLALLLSASTRYLPTGEGEEQGQAHESSELSLFLSGTTLTLSLLDWRYVPLLWLCTGFLPEIWTLIPDPNGDAIWDFLPAVVALADLCITTIPLISVTAALAGTRPGGLLWWSEGCPCIENASWAHRFGWLDIVGVGSGGRPSPCEPLLPNQFSRCRCDATSVKCGIVDPDMKEGALHAPEGVSQFNFILHVLSDRDVRDHCTVLNNTTNSYATVPAFRLGSMRNVE